MLPAASTMRALGRVLVAEPDEGFSSLLEQVAEELGHEALTWRGEPAAELPSLDLLLLEPLDAACLALARSLRRLQPELRILCITETPPRRQLSGIAPYELALKPLPVAELRGLIGAPPA